MVAAHVRSAGTVIAFIDVGTYAIRLLLVRLNPNQSYTILQELREPVRLGLGEFQVNRLQVRAMRRAEQVCQRFAEMARRGGAEKVLAVATSATREAENQREFQARLRAQAGLDLRVISGKEEARLIYLGVSRSLHLNGRTALFIDIGGGSTEIAVGDEQDYRYLDSVKLGTLRLTQMFALDAPGRVTRANYAACCDYVRSAAVRTIARLQPYARDLVVGSSGTLRNLAGICTYAAGRSLAAGDPFLRRAELRQAAARLCATPLGRRGLIPGLNPDRADVIIAGAAITETLMDELQIDAVHTTRRGLRDGLLVDLLLRRDAPHGSVYALSTRRRSILLLGRACGFDEQHAQRVAGLALELFDSARAAGLHAFGDWERELLEYAALLHDIGVFLSFVNHQAHTYYLVRHADLVGFDQTEIAIIAALARYHRKGRPRPGQPELHDLDSRGLALVGQLYVLMRLAERLERSHHGVIEHARLAPAGRRAVRLRLTAQADCTLEINAIAKDEKAFERAFRVRLEVSHEKPRRPRAVRQGKRNARTPG
jgi:exopolyphosphatase / guanosine-5'-triphosphate,3'-diphosphate pyrophosphatase